MIDRPAPLPGQPRDESGPVFREPWEAQAFAMTLALHERGLFSWSEWARALAAQGNRPRAVGSMHSGAGCRGEAGARSAAAGVGVAQHDAHSAAADARMDDLAERLVGEVHEARGRRHASRALVPHEGRRSGYGCRRRLRPGA